MATVLEYTHQKSGAIATVSWIAEQLQEVFDFVNVIVDGNTTDLYYSQNYYLRVMASTSNSFSIKVCGPDGFTECTLFTSATQNIEQYVRIVKTAKGDVALLATNYSNSATTGIPDNGCLAFVLVKCKHAVSGTEEWGLYAPTDNTVSQNFYTKLLVTEGTTNVSNNRINAVYTSAGGNKFNVMCGYNPLAPITVLIPIYAVSSAYVSENTFIMHITPRMYNGDTMINGKHYYCIGLIAMLDEAEE